MDRDHPSHDVPQGRPGELLLRGPQVFAGYWNRPEATDSTVLPDGWICTGDIVVMDDDGFFTLLDRIKEVIITGGFNVYPTEAEETLRQVPGVVDAAVVGLRSPDGAEEVTAAVVLEPGAPFDEKAVRDATRGTWPPTRFLAGCTSSTTSPAPSSARCPAARCANGSRRTERPDEWATVIHARGAGLVALAALLPMLVATGAAAATTTCRGVPATIVGTAEMDVLVGTPRADVIVAGAGSDTVRGRGADLVCSGDGADRLYGGTGADRLYGGRGQLVLADRSGGHLEQDHLTGGPGDDLIVGGSDSSPYESPVPDIVDYGASPRGVDVDLAAGTATGQGRDVLSVQRWWVRGSDQADTVLGCALPDRMSGGLGADLLVGRVATTTSSATRPWAPTPLPTRWSVTAGTTTCPPGGATTSCSADRATRSCGTGTAPT